MLQKGSYPQWMKHHHMVTCGLHARLTETKFGNDCKLQTALLRLVLALVTATVARNNNKNKGHIIEGSNTNLHREEL